MNTQFRLHSLCQLSTNVAIRQFATRQFATRLLATRLLTTVGAALLFGSALTACADAIGSRASQSTPAPSITTTTSAGVLSPSGTPASSSSAPSNTPTSESTMASNTPASPAVASTAPSTSTQLATFGAGCFWGVEAKFRKIPGVTDAAVGYTGGTTTSPTYKDVSYNKTGHAEVVQLTFDPSLVSYQTLLDAFFVLHDPTQLNRQGPDVGDQYRSVVFFHTPDQQALANQTIERLNAAKKFRKPIATKVEAAQTFWRGEEYHQQYLKKNGLETCGIDGQ